MSGDALALVPARHPAPPSQEAVVVALTLGAPTESDLLVAWIGQPAAVPLSQLAAMLTDVTPNCCSLGTVGAVVAVLRSARMPA
jgi:hypothetical protein